MGVYINMEMPKNCGGCKFFAWKRGVGQYCAVDDRITFHATIDGMDVAYERNGNCPLVPVPPHGRLGDLDAVEAEIREKTNEQFCVNIVHAAPTIIPADDSKLSATIKCGGAVTCVVSKKEDK